MDVDAIQESTNFDALIKHGEPKRGAIKGRIVVNDPDWCKPMTDEESGGLSPRTLLKLGTQACRNLLAPQHLLLYSSVDDFEPAKQRTRGDLLSLYQGVRVSWRRGLTV